MSSSSNHIIGTVVLLYFLSRKQTSSAPSSDGPLHVPLAVYDPEARTLPPAALRRSDLLSEMRQSIRHYEHAATSGGFPNARCCLRRRLRHRSWID